MGGGGEVVGGEGGESELVDIGGRGRWEGGSEGVRERREGDERGREGGSEWSVVRGKGMKVKSGEGSAVAVEWV